MHHLFITEQLSIYLVVFNVADDPHGALPEEDKDCGVTHLENLHFWLNSIHAHAPEADIVVLGKLK